MKTVEGKWEGETAAGCITEQDTFAKNPKFVVELPSEKVMLSCTLRQQKHAVDLEPFSIIPYMYYTGIYVFDSDITDPIDRDPLQRTTKFKNGRECKFYVH